MKSRIIVSAIALAALGAGSLSFAQGNDRRGPGNDAVRMQDQRGTQNRADVNRDGRVDRRDARPDDRRSGPPGFDNHRSARNDREYGARGPQWRRGGHIPTEYRRNQYVVNDWRGHQLKAPPRGQHWVQVGADYALVAIATGVITQLILNNAN